MSVTSTLRRTHHTAADHDTVLITDAPVSFTEQHDARVRKYVLLMSLRIPALVLAAVLYAVTGLWWLPLIVVAASLPLPWVAVLIANDGPPRARADVDRYVWGTDTQAPALAATARRELDPGDPQGDGRGSIEVGGRQGREDR